MKGRDRRPEGGRTGWRKRENTPTRKASARRSAPRRFAREGCVGGLRLAFASERGFPEARYFVESMYSTIFSPSFLTVLSKRSSSVSSSVSRKPSSGVKKDVSGTTQMPVDPSR